MLGNIVQDNVRIGDQANIEVDKFKFFLVYNEDDNEEPESDGVIGFALDNRDPEFISFVTALKNKAEIENRQFALYLNFEGGEISSNLMIDGYDLQKYSTESKFTYIPTATNFYGFWTLLCNKVMLGDLLMDFDVPAVIDSGSSLILGPQVVVGNITLEFKSKFGCSTNKGGNLVCPCKSPKGKTYPDLIFELNEKAFQIHPEDYMAELGDGICYIGIEVNDIFDDDDLEG
mmetsp:Transcript_13524/g.13562  ORF Transcript_13524/g.13562 Transcript_13524/m.13562 type:complete len:231 (-) Transcript_13524:114-806(-)